MPQFLEKCSGKQAANTYTYITCRTEHVYDIFIPVKILICLPEIQASQKKAHTYYDASISRKILGRNV